MENGGGGGRQVGKPPTSLKYDFNNLDLKIKYADIYLHSRLEEYGSSRRQNFVLSVKLKSQTFIGGTTMSIDSSPVARTGRPMASTFCNI